MRLKTIGKRGAGLLLSALLALSLCLPVSAAGGAGYTDLRGHWAESQLQWAVEQGYLTGTSATTLSPNKTLTRGMAAVILYRYAGSPTAGENSRFSDVPAGAYYAKAVAWVDQTGLMSGRGNGRFAPQANMTREEFLTVLYRLRVQTYGVPEQVGQNNWVTLADYGDHPHEGAGGAGATDHRRQRLHCDRRGRGAPPVRADLRPAEPGLPV